MITVKNSVGVLFCLTISASCSQPDSAIQDLRRQYPNRHFTSAAWDTITTIGGSSDQDTTLVTPTQVIAWGASIAILDSQDRNVRVFDSLGGFGWAYHREGGGPGEMKNPVSLAVSPAGALWVLDYDNAKLLEFDSTGYAGEHSLAHLPVLPATAGAVGDRVLFTSQSPQYGLMYATADSLRLVEESAIPWRDPLDRSLNIGTVFAADRDSGFVVAFTHGPGFVVGGATGGTSNHTYLDPVYFALKVSPRLRDAGGDSARYGAVSAAAIGGEIYFLFGGRPFRKAHDSEPTVLVDVYGFDGVYRRSYRLPFDTYSMAVRPDSSFVVLADNEDGLPFAMILRPRR